jgi:hypothetical protein
MLTLQYTLKALKPIWITWLAVISYAAMRLVPIGIYIVILSALYRLVIGDVSADGVQQGELIMRLIAVAVLLIAVPAFVHASCQYVWDMPWFYELTLKRMTNAHINVLLWIMFTLLAGSVLIIHDVSFDYEKAVALVLLAWAVVVFTVLKVLGFFSRRRA